MPFVAHSGETVLGVVEDLVSGATIGAIRRSRRLSPTTVRSWLYFGAPMGAPGIPPHTPLLIAAMRLKAGLPMDAAVTDAERAGLMKVAQNRRLHGVVEEFRRTLNFSEGA